MKAVVYKGPERTIGRHGLIKKGDVIHLTITEWEYVQEHGDPKNPQFVPASREEVQTVEKLARDIKATSDKDLFEKKSKVLSELLEADLADMAKGRLLEEIQVLKSRGIPVEYSRKMGAQQLRNAIKTALNAPDNDPEQLTTEDSGETTEVVHEASSIVDQENKTD